MLTLLTEEQLTQVPEELRGQVTEIQTEAQKAAELTGEKANLERQLEAANTKMAELENRLSKAAAPPAEKPAGSENLADDKIAVTREDFEAYKKAQDEAKAAERAAAVKDRVLAAEGDDLLPGYRGLVKASEDEAEVKASLEEVRKQMAEDLKAKKLQVADMGGGSPAGELDTSSNVGDDVTGKPASELIKTGLKAGLTGKNKAS